MGAGIFLRISDFHTNNQQETKKHLKAHTPIKKIAEWGVCQQNQWWW